MNIFFEPQVLSVLCLSNYLQSSDVFQFLEIFFLSGSVDPVILFPATCQEAKPVSDHSSPSSSALTLAASAVSSPNHPSPSLTAFDMFPTSNLRAPPVYASGVRSPTPSHPAPALNISGHSTESNQAPAPALAAYGVRSSTTSRPTLATESGGARSTPSRRAAMFASGVRSSTPSRRALVLDVSGSSQTSGSGKCIVFMFPVSDEKPVHLLFSKFNNFPVDLSQFSTHFVSSQLHLTLPGFRFAPVFIDSSYLISFSLSSPLVLLLDLWMDISGFKRLIPVSLAFMSFPTWCNLYSKCLKIFCY